MWVRTIFYQGRPRRGDDIASFRLTFLAETKFDRRRGAIMRHAREVLEGERQHCWRQTHWAKTSSTATLCPRHRGHVFEQSGARILRRKPPPRSQHRAGSEFHDRGRPSLSQCQSRANRYEATRATGRAAHRDLHIRADARATAQAITRQLAIFGVGHGKHDRLLVEIEPAGSSRQPVFCRMSSGSA